MCLTIAGPNFCTFTSGMPSAEMKIQNVCVYKIMHDNKSNVSSYTRGTSSL